MAGVSARDDYPQFNLFLRNTGLNAPPEVVAEMKRAMDEIDQLRAEVEWLLFVAPREALGVF